MVSFNKHSARPLFSRRPLSFIRPGPGLLALSFIFFSCSKLVTDQFPDYDPIPNVNSILVAGDSITMHVSMAEKIDITSMTLIDDAEIVLLEGQDKELPVTSIGNGLYISESPVAPGETYHFQINMVGYDEIIASDTVPNTTDVEITGQTNQSRLTEDGIFLEGIDFSFIDDPKTTDFYEVVIYVRRDDYFYIRSAFNENEKILLNEGLEPYYQETLVFSDELMEDSVVNMSLDIYGSSSKLCWGDSCFQEYDEHTLLLELRHVSRAYYTFKKHFYLYEKTRYAEFIEGTAIAIPNYSNIENGLGIVAAYASSLDSIFVEEERIFMER